MRRHAAPRFLLSLYVTSAKSSIPFTTMPGIVRKARTLEAKLCSSPNIPLDSVKVSPDLALELFGPDCESGHVVIQNLISAHDGFPWTLFVAQVDKSLSASTCMASSASLLILTTSAAHPAGAWVQIRAVRTPLSVKHVLVSAPADLYDQLVEKRGGNQEILNQTSDSSILSDLGFTSSIVRQGELLNGSVRIRLCEPVDQGLFDADSTKVTVVKEEHTAVADAGHGGQQTNQADNAGVSSITDTDIEMEVSKFLDYEVSFDDESLATSSSFKPIELEVASLDSGIFVDSIAPRPAPTDDMEAAAFVRIDLLAKLGCLSGDTVSVNERLMRVFSYPEPNSAVGPYMYMSPFTIYNLGSPKSVQVHKFSDEPLSKHLPVAKEITISRLASPITTERIYQQAFLSGLRAYFESCRRVVQNGDIVAVPIDTVLAQTLYAPGEEPLSVMPSGRPNEVAWFKITSLQSESLPTAQAGNEQKNKIQCVVDSTHTRMVQSGLVKGPCVPDSLKWKQYLGFTVSVDLHLTEKGSQHPSIRQDFGYANQVLKLLKATSLPNVPPVTLLLSSSRPGAGKMTVLRATAAHLGMHFFEIDCYGVAGESDVKTLATLRARLDRALAISPCLVGLKHLDVLAKKSDQDGQEVGLVASIVELIEEYTSESRKGPRFVLSCTVADADKLAESVRSRFKFEIDIPVPSESERRKIFEALTRYPSPLSRLGPPGCPSYISLRNDVSYEVLALQSAGLTPPDLVSILDGARVEAAKRFSSSELETAVLLSRGSLKITLKDLEVALSQARSKYSDSIGAPKIPNVGWQDVGGLEGVKGEILDSIEMPLKYPHLFSGGVKKRSGILFYGPPGTGKTLLAKAIATTFSLNFFSVKGPELLNMYIGESEANVRRVFQKARDAKPCVVFFDELDSVAPKRGNQGDSGGVMDRIVSQLLAELDGMSDGSGGDGVFVVGATNRPDLLDEALLRPGRFDKMLYLGISDTHDKQENILKALTRKFKLSPNVSLKQVAEKCPFTFTGADFYAMSSDAMLNAMTRVAGEVDEKIKQFNEERQKLGKSEVSTRWWFQNEARDQDIGVEVTEADFDKALRELVPSVSADELRHYLAVRDNFEGGKKQAQNNNENIHKQPSDN